MGHSFRSIPRILVLVVSLFICNGFTSCNRECDYGIQMRSFIKEITATIESAVANKQSPQALCQILNEKQAPDKLRSLQYRLLGTRFGKDVSTLQVHAFIELGTSVRDLATAIGSYCYRHGPIVTDADPEFSTILTILKGEITPLGAMVLESSCGIKELQLRLDIMNGKPCSSCSECNDLAQITFGKKSAPTEEFSASAAKIKAAHCLRLNPFSTSEIEQWLKANGSEKKTNQVVHGVEFKDEDPYLIGLFEKLTTPDSLIPHGPPPKIKQQKFNSSCHKVICAAKELFGEKEGLQLLLMLGRFGFNGSHLARDRADSWKSSELDDVLLALAAFPEHVLPLGDNLSLIRTRGLSHQAANAVIQIFNGWELYSREERAYRIVHEVGHCFEHISNIHGSPIWTKLSGWINLDRKNDRNATVVSNGLMTNPGAISSAYGMTNPKEDWAETVAAYRFDPEALKQRSPEKYALMKEYVFDGLEYTSEEKCQNELSLSARIDKAIQTSLLKEEISQRQIDRAQQECGANLFEEVKKVSNKKSILKLNQKVAYGSLDECVNHVLIESVRDRSISEKTWIYPEWSKISFATRSFSRAPAEKIKVLSNHLIATLVDILTQEFIDYVDNSKFSSFFESPSIVQLPAEGYCKNMTLGFFGIPAASKLNTSFFNQSNEQFQEMKRLGVLQDYYDFYFRALSEAACVKIQRNKNGSRKMQPDEVREAFASLLSNI